MSFHYKYFYKLYYFFFLLLLTTLGGTIGYMIIEEWEFVDAFYMTIITMSTVGFGEVRELTDYGKLFTAFIIVSNIGIFAYAVTSITTYIVGGEYRRYLREYRIMQGLKKMKDHVIICGYGRVGAQVAEDLHSHGTDFVIIEKDLEIIEEAKKQTNFSFITGDGTSDDLINSAGVSNAKAIITCLPKDADNLYVVLAAREFNKSIVIVSRASRQTSVSKLRLAGANNVIMPDSLGGSHMASLIATPDVMEFLDIIKTQGQTGANIESVSFEELPEDMQEMSIEDLDAEGSTGVKIIGMRDQAGIYHINPNRSLHLKPGCRLFVIGTSEQIKELVKRYHLTHK